MSHHEPISKGALQFHEPDPDAIYPIEVAAEIVNAPAHTILVYCRHGIIAPARDPEIHGYFFDTDAIHLLRRLEYLRTECEINMTGLRHIVDLANEVKRLRAELRFLRG